MVASLTVAASLVPLLLTTVVGLTDVEKMFLEVPDASRAKQHLYYLTSVEHMAGTPGDLQLAKYVRDRMHSYGIQSEIVPVDVLLSYPKERAELELVNTASPWGGVIFRAGLSEDAVPDDLTSTKSTLRNLTFNGYSPSGDVTARLVYANRGRPEDFDALKEAGVDVKGAIVLTRYGGCFRGLKAMNAQRRGAVGVLIYSDPADDGYNRGETYPNGPWRPSSGVQRGSVQFNSLCTGDPSRSYGPRPVEEVCGYSTKDLIPQIPVLPISYADAQPLLEALEGPVAPSGFQGGLNIKYKLGPTPANIRVHLKVTNEEHVGPIWNVISTIPGPHFNTPHDRIVMLGNHRDAWVYGAVDPNSGTASLLELARGLGSLLESGWKPNRTIVLASWSGEELGLLGSTAFAELNGEVLKERAIAYINVDSAVAGTYFEAAATPSLHTVIAEAAKDVEDPATGKSLAEAWGGEVGTLGSGSDYVAYLDLLGIASADMSFKGNYGVYHSVYDSFTWMSKYGDPDFLYHRTMAQLWGLVALRLSESQVLPLNQTAQADTVHTFVKDLEGYFADNNVNIETTALHVLLDIYHNAARRVHAELAQNGLDDATRAELNDRLAFTERHFLGDGLPGRPWFKHVLQAPGLYLGYDAVVFPGIRDAVDAGDISRAREQMEVLADRLAAAAMYLKRGDEALSLDSDDVRLATS